MKKEIKKPVFFHTQDAAAFRTRTAEFTQSPRWAPGGCPAEARTRQEAVAGWPGLGNVTPPFSASGHDGWATLARGNSDCYPVS